MTYFPASALTSSAGSDGAGGVISRTILAAGAVYSQSDANRFRSSIYDAYAALRQKARGAIGIGGGGYRPLTVPASFGLVGISPTGTTIPPAAAVYTRADVDEFNANMATLINGLLADLTTAKALTGPRGAAYTRITDNSGGTPGSSISAAGSVYAQGATNNVRASFTAKLEAIADAMGA
jgi:hypothetical protein